MPGTARHVRISTAARCVAATGLLAVATFGLGSGIPASAAEPAQSAGVLQAPLVVAGIAGLGWDDVSPTRTPALWALLSQGASAAAVTVHTTGLPACRDGGWLSLSAGRPVSGHRRLGQCLGLPPVVPGDGTAVITTWPDLVARQADSVYEPRLGTLGPTLADAGSCATAVGPGAALALADHDGTVERYRPRLTPDSFDCPVTFVDLGMTGRLDDGSAGPLEVDTALAAVMAAMPAGADLLVTSVASPLGKPLQMGVMVLAGGDGPGGWVSSSSTRRAGVVRLLDVPSTLVEALGRPEPDEFEGSSVVITGELGDPAATAESLADITEADGGLRAATGPLLNSIGGAALALLVVAYLLGRRRSDVGPRRGLAAASVVLAVAPVSSYLVAIVPWWDFQAPQVALWLGIGGIAVLLTAGVLTLARKPLWGPALAVSAVTTAVLVVDGVTGGHLHWASPLGTSPVLGNRYYGFGNTTYCVLAVHAIVLAGLVAARCIAAGRHQAATLSVTGIGVVAVAVDVWPTWGADVGGGLALAPAFGLLALTVSGLRLTATRVAGTLVGGFVLVAAVAGLDWLRAPEDRSHLGRFVQQVLDGDAAEVVGRKIDYASTSLARGGVIAWITLVVLIWTVLAAAMPHRFAPASLRFAMTTWPVLRATLTAVLVSAVLGSLVNDWGIRIATVVLTAALPVFGLISLLADRQRRTSDLAVDRSPTPTARARTSTATDAAAAAPSTAMPKDASANTSPTW